MGDILTVGGVKRDDLPNRVRNLAQRLSDIHGKVVAARESSGIQLYIGCPRCLEMEGDRALRKMKFSVNASKFFVMDQWAPRIGTYDVERCASCMKCKFAPRLDELLRMEPLASRGYKATESSVVVGSLSKKLIPDGKGHMVPPGPGKVCWLSSLPPDHPGRWYMETYRGFDIASLEAHMGACWCYEELPESRELEIFYKRLPVGFRSTPQGRIIFFASIHGALANWQGRIPEYVEGNHKYLWHPYRSQWVLCELKEPNPETGKMEWSPIPEIQASQLDWDVPKYRTAKHSARNETLFGYDAAVEWSKRTGNPTCILVEGPLDACRLGIPTVAMIGTFLSQQQAALILSHFSRVIHLPDRGEAGDKSRGAVESQLGHRCELIVEEMPEGCDDPGDLDANTVTHIRRKYGIGN